jgi:hypothetical protein
MLVEGRSRAVVVTLHGHRVILRTSTIKVTKETTVAAPSSVHPSERPAYPAALARLQGFRVGLYACFTRRADALFDLADALLSAQTPVASLPYLSLEPVHRRGWGSVYAALAHGRVDVERLRELLARHPLAGGQPIYAVDVTTWPRCDAECSPQRGLYYHPSRHSAGQPIIAGWAFQWICQLSFARDSVDRPGRRPPVAPLGRHRPDRRLPDPGAAGSPARRWARPAVCVRRRL